MPKEFCDRCVAHGAVGISVTAISEALSLVTGETRSILVSVPPALSQIPLIARISHSTELVLTIDHFVHAERIAAEVQDHQTEQSVVILLQGDKPGPGIRPGQDALRLAQGVTQLPGIRVIGITTSITKDQDSRAVINSAGHTQQQFREAGLGCNFVSVAAGYNAVTADNTVVTEIRDQHSLLTVDRKRPLIWLEAEVISRPSLEYAVLDVGQSLWATHDSIWFPEFPDAQVSHWFDDCCMVTATGKAKQLQIGDLVRIVTAVLPPLTGP